MTASAACTSPGTPSSRAAAAASPTPAPASRARPPPARHAVLASALLLLLLLLVMLPLLEVLLQVVLLLSFERNTAAGRRQGRGRARAAPAEPGVTYIVGGWEARAHIIAPLSAPESFTCMTRRHLPALQPRVLTCGALILGRPSMWRPCSSPAC